MTYRLGREMFLKVTFIDNGGRTMADSQMFTSHYDSDFVYSLTESLTEVWMNTTHMSTENLSPILSKQSAEDIFAR